MSAPGASAGERLRQLVRTSAPVEAMSCHSPLSALLGLEAGFSALWASGFELSALYGLPDAQFLGLAEHLDMTRRIVERTGALVIADLDTGFGNAANAAHAVGRYSAAGAAAVVIEDKVFPKMTSLIPEGRQVLIRIEEYQGKIAASLQAAGAKGPVVCARTEALVAGASLDEALERGAAYAEAGAELLLVHSKGPGSAEIEAFIGRWRGAIPLMIVPTAFPDFTRAAAAATGKVAVMIYANHGVRASVKAMREAFAAIRSSGAAAGAEAMIASTAEVFDLQGMDGLKRLESDYLR